MALNSDALLKVGTGAFYRAPLGTPRPADADILAPPTPWIHMGHTSIDDILSSAREGGEVTNLPTLQVPTGARRSVSAQTSTFNINLLQFDEESLKLYYGSNATVDTDGGIEIPEVPVPTEVAWLFVFRDGDRVGSILAKRASVIGAEDFGISDTESLSRLQLAITPMVEEGSAKASPWTFYPPVDISAGLGE